MKRCPFREERAFFYEWWKTPVRHQAPAISVQPVAHGANRPGENGRDEDSARQNQHQTHIRKGKG